MTPDQCPSSAPEVPDFHLVPTPTQYLRGETPTQLERVVAHLAAMPDVFGMGQHDRRVIECALAYLAQPQPTDHFSLAPGEGVTLPAGRLRLTSISEEWGAAAFAFEAGQPVAVEPGAL